MIDVEKTKDGKWAVIYKNKKNIVKSIIIMTSEDILELFNKTVPNTIEEPFLTGDPNCVHTWKPWAFNDTFIQCTKCPAMKKIKRLVPKVYKNG